MFIANSNLQPVERHLSEVGSNTKRIAQSLLLTNKVHQGFFPQISELCGLFHDIGKIEPKFQSYIQNEKNYEGDSGEKADFALSYPLHHEWSLLLVVASWRQLKRILIQSTPELKGQNLKWVYDALKYAVYWHHAEQQRDLRLKELFQNLFNAEPELFKDIIERFNEFASCEFPFALEIDEEDINDAIEKINEVAFMDVSAIQASMKNKRETIRTTISNNASNLLYRYCLIAADRYVSSLPVESMSIPISLSSYDDSSLLSEIELYIEKSTYQGERTEQQKTAADYLAGYDSNTLIGPAGSGKTRVALIDYYYSRTRYQSDHKGLVWAVPRVVVGLGVLDEIRNECPGITVSIISGEHKGVWKGRNQLNQDNLFDADIVIMTIDQISKRLTSHRIHDEFAVFLNRFVVFDEYHELFSIHSLYWISLMLMKIKEWQNNAHRFVSATPEPFHLSLVAESYYTYENPIVLRSFNDKPIHIAMTDKYKLHLPASIYVFNTATKAQDIAMAAYNLGKWETDCFHSKFTAKDRAELTQTILERYGKHQSNDSHILYAGPIAQAALNISRKQLFTEASSPANLLQRVGRCNRFAEHERGDFTIIVDKNNITENKGRYGHYGFIKNTGCQKHKIVNGKVLMTFSSHYSKLSYQFLRTLCKAHDIDTKTPLSKVSIDTNMNELMDVYLAFWTDLIQKDEEKQEELFDYVIETAELLRHYNAFKPTKRVALNGLGQVEVMISFRGESKLATMLEAHFDKSWQLSEFIATDNTPEHLVSISELEYTNIDLEDNLVVSPFSQLSHERRSYKHRAKHLGLSIHQFLAMQASNPATPIIASNPNLPNSPSLFYLTTSGKGHSRCLGYRLFDAGMNDLIELTK